MIWMAINSHFRPIWFVCDNGKLNTEKYIRLMRKFKNEIETRHPGLLESGTFVYQQDGAPAHCSNRSIRWLENYFSEVISKRPKSFMDDDKFLWVSSRTIELIDRAGTPSYMYTKGPCSSSPVYRVCIILIH